MRRNIYSEINLHINWHTKHDLPVIVDRIEERLYRYLSHRIVTTPNVVLHAIGGTADHIHLGVSVPPALPIADWIGEAKGSSAHYINHEVARGKVLEWQSGYGVVSFGTKDLEWVVRYIENQKAHHARGSIVERLERIMARG